MGYGPLAHFKGPSSFWARINPERTERPLKVTDFLIIITIIVFSIAYSGVVTVQDYQSGKSFSSILNLAKNVQKSPKKCLNEQNIHRKQSGYAYLIVNI